jgi:hypothetical protein
MNPLQQCPGCKGKLMQWHAGGLWEEICEDRCGMGFYQTFASSFEDEQITNLAFYTKHFQFVIYFPNSNYNPGITHVYLHPFPRGMTTQYPVFSIKNLQWDFDNLTKLNDKYHTLLTFT